MLNLVSVEKRFGELHALSEITISFGPNETVGLIGPNGSGKSTLVNVVTATYGPDAGQILFRGTDITSHEAHRISRLGIARTFQNLRLFQRMTVIGNVEAAQYGMPGNVFFRFRPDDRRNARNFRQKAEWALEQVGLQDVRNRLASSLPLPQLRRLEIARILARDPELVFLDEPAGGMTPTESEDMARLIADCVAPNRTCIVIEHKMDLIAHVCARVCVLNAGQLIADGDPEEVFVLPTVIEAYLGRAAAHA
ncbi:MAG: ATP-binding cassette domain-containing protein [Paracoccaceae bacterium]|nr:ATP-binding cassette domain-containing protein [Paracoccaceae bacterium]